VHDRAGAVSPVDRQVQLELGCRAKLAVDLFTLEVDDRYLFGRQAAQPATGPDVQVRTGAPSIVRRSLRMLVAVTDHAAERFRQRVRGTLDEKTEIASRVARAHAAGRIEPGSGGTVLVRDLQRRDVVYVCRPEGRELVVITLWEEGESAAVPRRFTDALRRDDHRVG
jgi:hypothetical protein